ncbi:MAG: hypothetical protein GY855_14660 [candidate division Zixibacteria bacterium]|nr:hypothetical protein [candidate division Zixibacteria bacterium]
MQIETLLYRRIYNSRLIVLLATVFAVLNLSGCGSYKRFSPPILPDDRHNIPEPKERNYNYIQDGFDNQITGQITQSFDLTRQIRNISNSRKQAFNANAFDEVPNSSWFTNRNARSQMSIEEILRGPDSGEGPDKSGSWIVKRAKTEGVTPGFTIKDPRGEMYLIKFDPQGYSELVTGAEVISTKLFYASGYHVPENYLTYFNPDILELDDNVKFTDSNGEKRKMTDTDLRELLDSIQRLPDGSIRALASKYIKGIPKGPFSYEGFRKDDPNDYIPHQHRRELRGLKVISAWLNHVDTKSGNSFDSYVTENENSYIRHYLIDFGSTLGSAAHGPTSPESGHINQLDPHAIITNLATLGLNVRSFEKIDGIQYPSGGLYEADIFNPAKFKSSVPNPAFENCTNLDGFWGAKIVMSFTDEQLKAIIDLGQYSNPEAAKYIFSTLIRRRDKIGRYWFNKVNPLDKFELLENADNQSLLFKDLAVETGLESAQSTAYKYEIRINGRVVRNNIPFNNDPLPELPGIIERNKLLSKINLKNNEQVQYEFRLYTSRNYGKNWSKWTSVFLVVNNETGLYELIGIRRQN